MLIDTHCHIYTEAFDADRGETIFRAQAAGVERMLLPAIDAESYERLFAVCRAHPHTCLPMIGLHPTSVNERPQWREELALVETYLRNPPVGPFCAVGEIGLDFYWSDAYKAEQTEALCRQLDWALAWGLPVAVHVRAAWPEMLALMRTYAGKGLRGVFHAFSDTWETYCALKACGDFVFGIGGMVTFKKNPLAEVVGRMDIRDVVLETDCPYLTPAPYRGRRNEPAYVQYVCEKVAALHGLPYAEVARITTDNARRMFGGMEPEPHHHDEPYK